MIGTSDVICIENEDIEVVTGRLRVAPRFPVQLLDTANILLQLPAPPDVVAAVAAVVVVVVAGFAVVCGAIVVEGFVEGAAVVAIIIKSYISLLKV